MSRCNDSVGPLLAVETDRFCDSGHSRLQGR
jgi:hypothetical protein